jgi:hypothetical protein
VLQRHVHGARDAAGELHGMLEIKLRRRQPFPKRLERLAKELAILQARPTLCDVLPCPRAGRADNPAHRGKECRSAGAAS